MSPIDIIVLGATGFTGRLITRYLYGHTQRRQFNFAIAGRSKSKLATLRAELGLNDTVETIIVDVTNFEEVESVVQRARVILNVVGPYWVWGTPVVHACARHGVHHVDLNGETPWVQDLIAEYDLLAQKNGAIIVPSCGFDSLPSDLSAFLSYRKLQEAWGRDVHISQSTTAAHVSGIISGGTAQTAIVLKSVVPKEKLKASRVPYSLSPVKGNPISIFKALYQLPVLKPIKYGHFFPLAPHNMAIVQRSWGLFRASKTTEFDYGPNFIYDEFKGTKSAVTAFMSSIAIATFFVLFSIAPTWLVKKLAPASGTGAPDEKLEKGWMHMVNVTSTDPKDLLPPAHVKTVIDGRGDPGYLLTSIMISECALALLDTSKLTETARKGGILTPAVAFGDTIISRLRATDRFTFESHIIEGAGKKVN